MENSESELFFYFLGSKIEVHKKDDLFVCATDAIKALNSLRSLIGYKGVRIDHQISRGRLNMLIVKISLSLGAKSDKPIKSIIDLNNIGLAYRSGKGKNQKWFIHYKIFLLILSSMDDSILNRIIVCAIDKLNPITLLSDLSNVEYVKENESKIKTYIAIDRVKNICKIGKTTDLKHRISSLRISNKSIEYIYTIDKNIESNMHKLLSGFRISGEWFDMDENMISGIAEKYGFKKFNGKF